ncbi:alpha/beta-hydrolase [Anaeromyces robustus]|uniref:Alpha/beta-hydrolase n=1 Tax=Anaeromyces robustus TaxID=1754192 RepID=A0A1Y1WXK1_9FUNG|nr:alpha/beta-hydrolase [Anaeromyces robustus]|eukprot:ORX78172.1 alpha/beta-hydrolase [Anaeromyces robustus]
MVSFMGTTRSLIIKTAMKKMKNKDIPFADSLAKFNEKPTEHKFKKGYKITFKKTQNKSRYLIIQKDTSEIIKKVVIFIHGGFYIMGLTSAHYDFAYTLCNLKNDLAVVLVDYSLAPEFAYPTQINEVMDIWKELITLYKPENIVLCSESAGSNCSLVLLQKLANEKKALPKAAIFISPMTDYTLSGESYSKNYQKDIFFGNSNEPLTDESFEKLKNSEIYTYYLGKDIDRKDPSVSPLFGNFTIFPKSLFIVSNNEMLLNDTLNVVTKIKKENKDTNVECYVQEGMYHSYVLGSTWIPECKLAQDKLKSYILENLY